MYQWPQNSLPVLLHKVVCNERKGETQTEKETIYREKGIGMVEGREGENVNKSKTYYI